MTADVHGIHHVIGISGDVHENLMFYSGVLGMRLVKKSVNQDDPSMYHLFYADGVGTPGTDLTFFPWSRERRAQVGTGLTVEVPLAVPVGNLDYWQKRFEETEVSHGVEESRFGERTLSFVDPHGLWLALVEIEDARTWVPWQESPVPPEHQIRGIHSIRLWERALQPTEDLLTRHMGFRLLATDNGWHRYGVNDAVSGNLIELKELPEERRGRWGIGPSTT